MNRCRSDLNQSTIVRQLRQIGATVEVVSKQAHGFDLVIGYLGNNYLAEVKQPQFVNDLTDKEKQMRDTWRGNWFVITSIDDFIEKTGLANK